MSPSVFDRQHRLKGAGRVDVSLRQMAGSDGGRLLEDGGKVQVSVTIDDLLENFPLDLVE